MIKMYNKEEIQKSNKFLKSPLRYPGGKSRISKYLVDLFPKKVDIIYSFFAGGLSVELEASNRGSKVISCDLFAPVAHFWIELLKDPTSIINDASDYLTKMTDKLFYDLQEELRSYLKDDGFSIKNKKNFKRVASLFFILNRSSFSGTTLSGGVSPNHPRFNENCIKNLYSFFDFKLNLCVKHENYIDICKDISSNDFIYADPPYLIDSNLYGNRGSSHKEFNHFEFFDIMKNLDKNNIKWMISYNCCGTITSNFKNYNICFPEWKYGMGNSKKSKEVLITNYK